MGSGHDPDIDGHSPLGPEALKDRVAYHLRRTWPNPAGTKVLVLDPVDFLRRRAAIIPSPYTNLFRYHGVFANRSRGLGDALLSARYRFLHRGPHHLAVFFGLKLPSGNTRQKDDSGARLGAHNQPGTGSVDFQVGVAYTFAWKHLELSADLIGNLRTEGATQYRVGNSIQADVAISYAVRFWVPIIELNFVWGERDFEDNQVLPNSGFRALHLTAGMRFKLGRGHNLWAAFSYPVYQPLPGIQNAEFFRVAAGYGFSFRLGASSPATKKGHHHHHH